MFKSTKTHWQWTKLTETMHPDRKEGQPVYQHYRTTVPRSWVEKGYVQEASQEGQVEMALEEPA